MSATARVKPVSAGEAPAEARVARYDWRALGKELDTQGCAVLDKLLTCEECEAIAALYPGEERFRSHIVMARHGFGKGEYRYFSYPLPELIAGLRDALYPRLAPIANAWNERMGEATRYPAEHAEFLETLPRGRPDAADAPSPAIRAGRFQLPASGPLRRSRFSAAGRGAPIGAGSRFHGRRVRADRAAAAHAEPGRSRPAAAGRRGGVRRAQPAGEGHEGILPGEHAARRQPSTVGATAYGGGYFSRCAVRHCGATPSLRASGAIHS